MSDTFVLKISPPQRCFDPECDRWTDVAEAQLSGPHDRQIDLTPACWEHGYIGAIESSQEEEYASIARFVVGYHEGHGQAVVLGPCPLDNVPGVDPDCPLISEEDLEDMDSDDWHSEWTDEAWYVDYSLGSQIKHLAAVWCNAEGKFLLYGFSDSEKAE